LPIFSMFFLGDDASTWLADVFFPHGSVAQHHHTWHHTSRGEDVGGIWDCVASGDELPWDATGSENMKQQVWETNLLTCFHQQVSIEK
jgi:hypothetical protein